MRSRRGRSGYVLAATLAILFVLFILAMAMQYMGSRARQSYMLQEADFLAEQAVENQLVVDEARMQGAQIPTAPSATAMYLKKYDGWNGGLMIGPTTELFGNGPAPALYGRPQAEAPEGKAWHAYSEWSPRSLRADLNSFGRSRVVASYSAGFPYAVYAPQGVIQLTQALPYGDPLSSRPSQELNGMQDFTSGLQVKLAAGEGVSVTDAFPYGEAYTKSGKMALEGSGALGFYGQVPMDGYAARLTADINQAYVSLAGAAAHGDKTKYVNTYVTLQPRDLVLSLLGLNNQSLEDVFDALFRPSVRQAMAVPIPVIPTISIGVLYNEITFHMPFPPDQDSFGNNPVAPANDLKAQIDQIDAGKEQIQKDIDRLDNELNDLEARQSSEIAAATDDAGRDAAKAKYQGDIDSKTDEVNKLVDQLKDKGSQVEQLAKGLNVQPNLLKMMSASGPETRAEEEAPGSLITPKGVPGFNYAALTIIGAQQQLNDAKQKMIQDALEGIIKKFASNLLPTSGGGFLAKMAISLIKNRGKLKAAIKDFITDMIPLIPHNDVRVVNFGHEKDKTDQAFQFSATGFTSLASWTVPRGRSLTLQGDVTIQGDLWIQRGATMVVNGNLVVANPHELPAVQRPEFWDPSNPLSPRGRIILEQGATLLVERNLTVTGGTKLLGSVIVCSPPGSQAPITSGILCRGNVSFRYGVQPGMGVDDLMGFLTSQGDTSLKEVHEKYLSPLLASVAPNAAKIVGPFHPRLPFIAQFATTIGFAVIIPFPAPIPYDNVCVPIFRVLSYVYSISLNYTLGENLYLQSDWWIFGNGCVPVVPRVEPRAIVGALKGFQAPIPSLADPRKFFETQLERFTQNVCKALAKQVGTEILKMVGKEVAGILEGAKQAGDIANKAIGFIQQQIGDPLQSLTDDLKNQLEIAVKSTTAEYIEKPVRQVIDRAEQEIQSCFERAMLRNCPGLLVYAGGSLSVGTAGDPGALAAGMFVAGDFLTLECDRTVGTLVSASGDVKARAFMYNPYFSHASLYQPKDSPDWTGLDWFTAGTRFEYASDQDSKAALEIGPPVYHMTAQGWTQQ